MRPTSCMKSTTFITLTDVVAARAPPTMVATDQRESRKNFSPDCHFTKISRTCLAFSAMAADKNWMSVPVDSNRAPMAINAAASSGRVERPPTPTCLPYLRQAAIGPRIGVADLRMFELACQTEIG